MRFAYLFTSLVLGAFLFLRVLTLLPTKSNFVAETKSEEVEAVAQALPITAKAFIGKSEILLEVAETPEQKAKGLMFRSDLPDNRGMLFPIEPEQEVQVWMKDVEFPLDIIFIRDGRVQSISENVPQCDERCPLIQSQQPVNYVIEVSGGTSQSLGLSSKDDIKIIYLEAK